MGGRKSIALKAKILEVWLFLVFGALAPRRMLYLSGHEPWPLLLARSRRLLALAFLVSLPSLASAKRWRASPNKRVFDPIFHLDRTLGCTSCSGATPSGLPQRASNAAM